ncbi:MAG: hypothetical protein M3H12_14555 [Chromatiales bacterium]|nr:hypothetical protein [Gammaproteobacteria bacterium]
MGQLYTTDFTNHTLADLTSHADFTGINEGVSPANYQVDLLNDQAYCNGLADTNTGCAYIDAAGTIVVDGEIEASVVLSAEGEWSGIGRCDVAAIRFEGYALYIVGSSGGLTQSAYLYKKTGSWTNYLNAQVIAGRQSGDTICVKLKVEVLTAPDRVELTATIDGVEYGPYTDDAADRFDQASGWGMVTGTSLNDGDQGFLCNSLTLSDLATAGGVFLPVDAVALCEMDSVAVSQETTSVVGDLAAQVGNDAVLLTQGHHAATSEVSGVSSLDTVGLLQGHQLLPADLDGVSSIDTPVIVQGIVARVSLLDVESMADIESLSLQQGQMAIPAGMTIQVAVDAVLVVQGSVAQVVLLDIESASVIDAVELRHGQSFESADLSASPAIDRVVFIHENSAVMLPLDLVSTSEISPALFQQTLLAIVAEAVTTSQIDSFSLMVNGLDDVEFPGLVSLTQPKGIVRTETWLNTLRSLH